MNDLKTAFIINPESGGKRKNKLRKATIGKICEMFPDAPLELSSSSEEASGLTRQFLEKDYECIAAVGGDGTFNSVVQGFFADDEGTPVNKNAALATIPMGTGGDFRKSLGIENDPLAALSLLTSGATKPCDVGIVEFTAFEGNRKKKYFLNITSFGLGGLVDKYVLESSKKLGGTLTFFFATLRAFKNYKNARVEVTIDDKDKRQLRSLMIVVANGRFFGSGMEIAPMADIRDGLFEIILLGNLHMKDFIKYGKKLYGGKSVNHPEVNHKSARKINIMPLSENEPMYVDLDGEPLGTTPASVEIIPSAINIKI